MPTPVPYQIYTDNAKADMGEKSKPKGSIPMPDKPYPWQKIAPCDAAHGESEKVGGCWGEMKDPPPCMDIAVETGGRCFVPIPAKPKSPSTIEPKK